MTHMRNPFEKPKAPPQDEESVEIDVSDLREYKEDPSFGAGTKDFDMQDLAAGQERAKFDTIAESEAGEREDQAVEAAAAQFLQGNVFFKKRFGNDPEAWDRFRQGLKAMMREAGIRLGYMDEATKLVDFEGLRQSPSFPQELVKYSFRFEEEEDKRSAGRRAA